MLKEFLNTAIGGGNYDEMSVSTIIIGLVTLPFRFLFHFIAFLLTSWASSRSGFAFVRGLPAICAGGGLIFALVVAGWFLETRNVNRYENLFANEMSLAEEAERAARAARTDRDEELAEDNYASQLSHAKTASGYAEKLLGYYPDNPKYYHFLGLARFKNGDKNGAFEVMKHIGEKGLLVENSEGESESVLYPPAAVWLAETTLNDSDREPSQEKRIAEAEEYYLRAIDLLDVENDEEHLKPYIESNLGLAQIYNITGDTSGAITCFENAVNKKLIIAQQVAAIPFLLRLLRTNGDDAKAQALLSSNLKNIMELARQQPDQSWFWTVIVQSCEAVDDFESANRIIREAEQLATDANTRKNITQLRGYIQFARANAIKDISQFGPFVTRLNAAAASVQLNPRDRRAYSLLTELVWGEEQNENYDQWLMRSLVSAGKYSESPNPAVPHLVIGLRYLNSGRISEGTTHWLIANEQLKSRCQTLLNNLLEIELQKLIQLSKDSESEIANQEERFDNILNVISVASETFPNQPAFHITSGSIHLFREQNELAIADFQQALKKNPNLLDVHKFLMVLYTKIGETEKANFHTEEFERITKQINDARASLNGR